MCGYNNSASVSFTRLRRNRPTHRKACTILSSRRRAAILQERRRGKFAWLFYALRTPHFNVGPNETRTNDPQRRPESRLNNSIPAFHYRVSLRSINLDCRLVRGRRVITTGPICIRTSALHLPRSLRCSFNICNRVTRRRNRKCSSAKTTRVHQNLRPVAVSLIFVMILCYTIPRLGEFRTEEKDERKMQRTRTRIRAPRSIISEFFERRFVASDRIRLGSKI